MGRISIKTEKEIRLMKEACRVTALILDAMEDFIKPGITTEQINNYAEELMRQNDATSATLGYRGFPKSLCTSVNEVICHGIPSAYEVLKEGDIINVDVTCIKYGFHGDSSRMYFVGGRSAASKEAKILVDVARESLLRGIAAVKPGNKTGNIGAAIEKYIRQENRGYGIVVDYTGHGLGRKFHEDPQILHVGEVGKGTLMRPGMTFTIEPMINEGTYKTVLSKVDNWTVRTADGKLSAQWEHTVLVTNTGCEVLTASPTGLF